MLIAVSTSFHFAFGQRFRLHLQVDLGIDVGSAEGDMAQPGPDGVDVHAGLQQMHGCRVSNDVRADSFAGN